MLADRHEVEHRVERRDFEHADIGHVEQRRDLLDHRLRAPPFLLLPDPQRGNHRALLPARWILGNVALHARFIFLAVREALRLLIGWRKTAKAHRSISPKTISIDTS